MTNADKTNENKPTIDDIKEPYDTEDETSFDAKVMEEEIEVGEIEEPQANVEGDYEKSKQYSQSSTPAQKQADSL